jgi:hypothetical protein
LDELLSRYFLEVRVEGLFGEEALNEIERRRVRQKPSKVYFTTPLKRYVIRPIQRLLLNNSQVESNGTSSRRARKVLKKARLQELDGVVTEPEDYLFTTSDLELRSHSLRRALDLRATVLRVK